MIYQLTLYLFISLCLVLLVLYLRELKYRHQPFFRIPADDSSLTLAQVPKPLHSVALIGDIGAITDIENDEVMKLLRQWMLKVGKEGTIILLGDNIYPIGLPPENHRRRARSEQRLQDQLDFLQQFPGLVIYLSGNHDWNKGRKDGYEYLLRQQEFVSNYTLQSINYLPANGCLGPVEIPLYKGYRLIIINTQWWVQRGIRPIGKAYGCHLETEDDFFRELKELLDKYQHEQIVVAAHHPLYSNAAHGGKFTMKQHVFPLTTAHKKLYVPLPIAGSVYPIYRKLFGANEDMSHPRYRRMRKKLLRLFKNYQNIVYGAGHDHNLQYFPVRGNHYLVSGSGSKVAYVKKGGKAAFTHEHKGFFTVDYYGENQTWLRALEPVADPAIQTEIIFSRKIS